MAKLVYIASPYTKGDAVLNIRRSIHFAEQIRELGYVPECPLLSHLWHMISPHDYEYWMSLCLDKLEHCDILVRLMGDSPGADREVEHARKMGITVYYGWLEFVKGENIEQNTESDL